MLTDSNSFLPTRRPLSVADTQVQTALVRVRVNQQLLQVPATPLQECLTSTQRKEPPMCPLQLWITLKKQVRFLDWMFGRSSLMYHSRLPVNNLESAVLQLLDPRRDATTEVNELRQDIVAGPQKEFRPSHVSTPSSSSSFPSSPSQLETASRSDSMMDLQNSTVNISGSTLNDINRDQNNIGRDHTIYNLSDVSSESLVSVSGSAVISITTSSRKRRSRASVDGASSDDGNGNQIPSNADRRNRARFDAKAKNRPTLKDCYASLEQEIPKSGEIFHGQSKVNLLQRGK